MRQARSDALLDDAALELGKHAQHLKLIAADQSGPFPGAK